MAGVVFGACGAWYSVRRAFAVKFCLEARQAERNTFPVIKLDFYGWNVEIWSSTSEKKEKNGDGAWWSLRRLAAKILKPVIVQVPRSPNPVSKIAKDDQR